MVGFVGVGVGESVELLAIHHRPATAATTAAPFHTHLLAALVDLGEERLQLRHLLVALPELGAGRLQPCLRLVVALLLPHRLPAAWVGFWSIGWGMVG